MWWASAIQAGLSLFGASKQKKAAKEGRVIAGLNVAASRAETAETLRRQRRTSEQEIGYAHAIVGASGFTGEGGQATYISEMEAEAGRQQMFTQLAGIREANILKRGGELAYKQGKATAMSTIGAGVGQLGNMWSQGASSGLWGKA